MNVAVKFRGETLTVLSRHLSINETNR